MGFEGPPLLNRFLFGRLMPKREVRLTRKSVIPKIDQQGNGIDGNRISRKQKEDDRPTT